MRTTALTLLLATVALTGVHGQSALDATALMRHVRHLEEARRQALLQNDARSMDTLVAAEFSGIHSLYPGRVLSKSDELASFGRDRRVFAWVSRDESIRVFGNVGIVTAVAEVSDSLRGQKRRFVMQYTHIWALHDGRWQLVHRHTSRVATLEGPAPPATPARPNEEL